MKKSVYFIATISVFALAIMTGCNSSKLARMNVDDLNTEDMTCHLPLGENGLMRGEVVRINTSDETDEFKEAWIKSPLKAKLTADEMKELKKFPFLATSRMEEEGDETVLHCYLHTGEDNMKNIWLGGDDTYIVDDETGARYKARGSYSSLLWNQSFGVIAPRGSLLDFPIKFPSLPEDVKRIRLYGVPNWGYRGTKIWLSRKGDKMKGYDTIPHLRAPELEYPAHDYNKDDMSTYSCYKEAHLIAPTDEYTMAAWLTPKTTYLAVAFEQNWIKEYFTFLSGTVLVDNTTGKKYKLRKVQGVPMNELFFIHGVSGDMLAFVLEFEPLPLSVTSIDYLEADGKPYKAWGADWHGKHIINLPVSLLRNNQKKFGYYERKIVK